MIELLVVVAIIALLAAILFPVFGRARENARKSSCQSNLKQIATAITQYAQDYDEHYPLIVTATSAGYGWAANIQPYLSSNQVHRCPSTLSNTQPDPTQFSYTNYLYNRMLNTVTSSSSTPARGRALSEVRFPSQTVMAVDAPGGRARSNSAGCNQGWDDNSAAGGNNGNGCATGASTRFGPALLPVGSSGLSANRHLGGVNFAFVDGHVKWFKASERLISTNDYRYMESNTIYTGHMPIGSDPSTTPATNDGGTVTFGFGL